METDKVCIIASDCFGYTLHVDGVKVSISDSSPDYFKKHYLEYGYTVILDVIEDNIPITLTPTADRRIQVSYYTTLGQIDNFKL